MLGVRHPVEDRRCEEGTKELGTQLVLVFLQHCKVRARYVSSFCFHQPNDRLLEGLKLLHHDKENCILSPSLSAWCPCKQQGFDLLAYFITQQHFSKPMHRPVDIYNDTITHHSESSVINCSTELLKFCYAIFLWVHSFQPTLSLLSMKYLNSMPCTYCTFWFRR